MTFRYHDRIRVNCVPSGLGDINLTTVPLGYIDPSTAGWSDGDTSVFGIVVPVTGEFLICNVTYNAGVPSISRGGIITNHLGTTANVDFIGGSAGVMYCGLSSDKAIHKDMTYAEFLAAGITPLASIQEITATGTTQGTAAQITGRKVFITSGAATTSIKLPTLANAAINDAIQIVDKTGVSHRLFPDSSSAIDSLAANHYFDMAPYQSLWMIRQGSALWYSA